MAFQTAHTYAGDLRSPAAARMLTTGALESWGRADMTDVACLLTSELVTNAVVHAPGDLSLRLTLDDQTLRVEIRDGSTQLPESQLVPNPQKSGRGLQIVGALSTSWGTSPVPGGKVVWFELRA